MLAKKDEQEGAETNFDEKSKATKLTKAEQQQNTTECELFVSKKSKLEETCSQVKSSAVIEAALKSASFCSQRWCAFVSVFILVAFLRKRCFPARSVRLFSFLSLSSLHLVSDRCFLLSFCFMFSSASSGLTVFWLFSSRQYRIFFEFMQSASNSFSSSIKFDSTSS